MSRSKLVVEENEASMEDDVQRTNGRSWLLLLFPTGHWHSFLD